MPRYTVVIRDTQEADTPEEAAEAFIEQLRLGDYETRDVEVTEEED